MSVKVVDASALAAVLLVEPQAGRTERRLAGHDLAAPALIDYEVGNVCWKRARDDPGKADFYAQAMRELTTLDLARYSVDPMAVWQLAGEKRLTFYDASYLWLAQALDAELVTLDKALNARSRR
jgi:predicted nucleic acid-binding protein